MAREYRRTRKSDSETLLLTNVIHQHFPSATKQLSHRQAKCQMFQLVTLFRLLPRDLPIFHPSPHQLDAANVTIEHLAAGCEACQCLRVTVGCYQVSLQGAQEQQAAVLVLPTVPVGVPVWVPGGAGVMARATACRATAQQGSQATTWEAAGGHGYYCTEPRAADEATN